MNRKEQLLRMLDDLERDKPDLDEIINQALKSGIEAEMHVGKTQEWFNEDRDTRVPEWLMGQFVAGHLNENYIAYNTGINISRSFLNGTY